MRDNGIGMSPEFAGRIFEAFEREKTSTVSGIQGTGLGMAITKRIVDCMGGSIAVQTAPGEGSEFIVSLVLPVAESVQRETAESGQETDFTGRRILLVDDIEFNRELAGDILEMMGFEVDMAADGCEAVERVRDAAPGTYDVVLMDIQMPKMNGYEATRAIRSLPGEQSRVPILAMTANAFEEDRKNAMEAGMNGHLAKPIEEEKLTLALQKLIPRP